MTYLYDFTLILKNFSKFGSNFHPFNLVTLNKEGKISCCCNKRDARPSNASSDQCTVGHGFNSLLDSFESPTLIHSLNLHFLSKGKINDFPWKLWKNYCFQAPENSNRNKYYALNGAVLFNWKNLGKAIGTVNTQLQQLILLHLWKKNCSWHCLM